MARARSLRGTMLGWTALLLAAVVALFCAVLHGSVTRAVYAGVDETLASRARAIAGALEWDERDGWELEISDEFLRGLTDGGWYAVQDAAGANVRQGGTPVADARELVLAGPHGASVRVGRSIAAERSALARLLLFVAGAGVALVALALLGGRWLAARTLRPIAEMSRTAGRISEHDLAQRLDPERVPEELRELATTLNAAFERLEQAFQRQSRFTADASHELRTPLAVIHTQAEQALRHERTPADYRAALEACLRAARRMTGMVDGLLALARADGGERVLAREEVALETIAREATADARAQLPAERTVELDLEPVRVVGDASLLGEVVTNLVTNALRYGGDGGRIEVSLHARDGAAVLAVSDDGPGISAEALPHVFERFFRADPARSRHHGGAGLGLAITRWIVEAHGGAIAVESRPGMGSRFTVTLPAARVA